MTISASSLSLIYSMKSKFDTVRAISKCIYLLIHFLYTAFTHTCSYLCYILFENHFKFEWINYIPSHSRIAAYPEVVAHVPSSVQCSLFSSCRTKPPEHTTSTVAPIWYVCCTGTTAPLGILGGSQWPAVWDKFS